MKKIEFVYREILHHALEKKERHLSQSYLAKTLQISLSTVNLALRPLVRMNAVRVGKRGLDIIDVKKILYYWASIRNVEKDLMYTTRVEEPVREIEKQMPGDVVFTAYSAYKFKFKDVPADYSEVYVYGSETTKKRFGENQNSPNVFVLKQDPYLGRYGKLVSMAHLFVDLWNLRQWYAKEFLVALEGKIDRLLE